MRPLFAERMNTIPKSFIREILKVTVNPEVISFAGGLVAKELVQIDNDTGVRELTTSLVWTAGIFYDRENSLLASLILFGTKGYRVRVNIYPGVIKFGRLSPGFFINLRKDNQAVLGFHFIYLLPALARRIR